LPQQSAWGMARHWQNTGQAVRPRPRTLHPDFTGGHRAVPPHLRRRIQKLVRYMSVTVIRPGLASTFQDCGRHGHQHLGMPVGGAMETRPDQLPTVIACNAAGVATFEIPLQGPSLHFDAPALVAMAGADRSARLNGLPAALGRPLVVHAGDMLSI